MKKFKPIPKMDSGLLCNKCRVIIRYFKSEDEAGGESGPVLCDKCLDHLVYNYKTKNMSGFTGKDIINFVSQFPTLNKEKFKDALHGVTCVMIDGELVIYHCDIVMAIKCGLENRKIEGYEWD